MRGEFFAWVLKHRGLVAALVAVVGTTAVGGAGAAGAAEAIADATVYAIEDNGNLCFSLGPDVVRHGAGDQPDGGTRRSPGRSPAPIRRCHNASSASAQLDVLHGARPTRPRRGPRLHFTANGTYDFVCDVHAGSR